MKKKGKTTIYWVAVLVVGFVLFALGIASQFGYLSIAENNDMFNGLLSGLGGGLLVISAIMLIRIALMSPKKRRAEEIGMKDERNIAVSRAAMSVAYVAAMLLFAIVVVAFIWMKLTVPALIVTGALIIQVIVLLSAYVVLNKKM
jgi:hypothetical protein